MRARKYASYVSELDRLVPQAKADLIIVDEAHRVSPNGAGYRRIIDRFREKGKRDAHFMGLTASPERRTGDQRDQLSLAFDAIIDCADIQDLINEGILVKPRYPSHFVHDLDLDDIDVSSGEYPVSRLTDEIVNSSMLDYATHAYMEERTVVNDKPISAWFCPDIRFAQITEQRIMDIGITAAVITAGTPIKEPRRILAAQSVRDRRGGDRGGEARARAREETRRLKTRRPGRAVAKGIGLSRRQTHFTRSCEFRKPRRFLRSA